MATLDFDQIFALAVQYHRQGRLTEAIAGYRRAIALRPGAASAHNNLAVACREAGLTAEAIAASRSAVMLAPHRVEMHLNLGNLLRESGDVDEAIAAHHQGLRVAPNFALGFSNLGVALQEAGRVEEAIESYRQAMRLDPGAVVAHSNLLYAMHFDPRCDARMILEEHLRWAALHADALGEKAPPCENERSPERMLRVGYVAHRFGDHVIGRFMLPLLRSHDRGQFEPFCYSAATSLGAELPDAGATWRSTRGLSDEQLAQLIRQDRIDILVDLGLHMSGSRLLTFARKPAPVQVTYLAYCSTSGLRAMDYRLTDGYLDPPSTGSGQALGEEDQNYVERSVRLETYWRYDPPADASAPGPLPAASNGHVTFGSMNHFSKITAQTLRVWGRLLTEVPNSRLILHARPGSHRRRVVELLGAAGVSAERVEFAGFVPTPQYFEQYRRIDIGLDPSPYAGGTTTLDALWMGVPVVTLSGKTAVGRGGVSILSNLGLEHLIATTLEQYVQIARGLAGDLPRLGGLRESLRQRMRQSPILDASRFARNVEATFRQMWREWCARPLFSPSPGTPGEGQRGG
jgi:predicted O-linked N-acetylglucosamine transferase (SPINDLY family)